LLGETPVLNFLSTIFVMNAMLRILLTSLPINKDFSGICGNIDNVLFLHSNGCVPYSSSEFVFDGAYFFCTSDPELGPSPTSLPFFFSSSVGRT
jgi:hypothetical protein